MSAPVQPNSLEVTRFDSQSVTLSWADASSDELSFVLEYRFRTTEGALTSWSAVVLAANAVSHTMNSLFPDTYYEFRVKALNADGESPYSNVVTQTTLDLYVKAYTNASAAGVDGCEVQIWYPPADGGLTAGEFIYKAFDQKFNDGLELNPTTNRLEAVMYVRIPVPSGPVLKNGDPVRVYIVGRPDDVETFTRIMRDPQVFEIAGQGSGGGGGGGGVEDGTDPIVSGSGKIRDVITYTPGSRTPISGSWWVVNGRRQYPTDRTFIGVLSDAGKVLQAEDVVNGVSYFSNSMTLTSADPPESEVVIGPFQGLPQIPNIHGSEPQPVAPPGMVFTSDNLMQSAGGGLSFIQNGLWMNAFASLYLGSSSVNHEVTWSNIDSNAYILEFQFSAVEGQYTLYSGANNGAAGLGIRFSRNDNLQPWAMHLVKYSVDAGATVESLVADIGEISYDASEITCRISRNGQDYAVEVFPNNKILEFTYSQLGRWISVKMAGNSAPTSPLISVKLGIGEGLSGDQIAANDFYVENYYRDFSKDQRRSIISDAIGPGVAFVDKLRWYPAVINEEAQVFVTGSDFRGHYANPSPTRINHDPYVFDPGKSLNIVCREATYKEREYLNDMDVLHVYPTHQARIAFTGFAPSATQRGWQNRVRVASDNTFWYLQPVTHPQAGQWRRCGLSYLSGSLSLRGLWAEKYCTTKFRFSCTKGAGVWLAAWLVPTSNVESAEIDINESMGEGALQRGAQHANTHEPDFEELKYSTDATQQRSGPLFFFVGGDMEQEHCIECDWNYDGIRWYYDGRLAHTGNNIAFEPMTLLITLSMSNGNPGFQDRAGSALFPIGDETTPNPVTLRLYSVQILKRPSSAMRGPVMLARPVIRDNGSGGATVVAPAIMTGAVGLPVKHWRRYLFPIDGQAGTTYNYSGLDESQLVSYVEDYVDAAGVKTRASSYPLYIQNNVGTLIDAGNTGGGSGGGGDGGGGGGGDTSTYTEFDFTKGTEPPGAIVSVQNRFVFGAAYQPGLVAEAPQVGFSAQWSNLAGTPALSQNFAAAPDGSNRATRMVVAAGNANVGIRRAMSGLTPGQHTNHVWVRSNTGSNQSFSFRSLVTGNYTTLTATTSWQRFHTVGNVAGDWFSFDIAATASALDILVYGMDMFTGDQSGRTDPGASSYLDLLSGQYTDLRVTPGTYDALVTSDTNSIATFENVVIAEGQVYRVPGPQKVKFVKLQDPSLNDPIGGGGPTPGDGSSVLGGYVNPSPSYVPSTRPADTQTILMLPTDPPYKIGALGNGWHRDGRVQVGGFPLPHERSHDVWPPTGQDDGGYTWGRVARAGRHIYDKPRMDQLMSRNGGCPKLHTVYLTPGWAVSEANKTLIRNRFGNENQYGQISGPSRYPSYPYSAMPPENWEYLAEYIRWLYRPTNQNGPGGEPGAGYTPAQIPVIEYGNEQKFGEKVPNTSLRYWDYQYASPNPFNLHTPGEMAIAVRICKANVPAGVLVSIGGWEGDSNGKTRANPNAGYSFFQAWALSSDGAGGVGIDHVDIIFIHPYMYSYNPERVAEEIDGYRKQLEWLADDLGKPHLAKLPIHANETGHESTTGKDGEYGTGTWIINNQGQTGYNTLARNMKRSTLMCVANASRRQVVGITHYKDLGYAAAGGTPIGRQTYGSPSENATLTAAGQFCNQPVGRVVRQAVIRTNGEYWVEFEGNLILQA